MIHKNVLPDSEQHHESLIPGAEGSEEIFFAAGGDLDGIGDNSGCPLFCDGENVLARNHQLATEIKTKTN
jgi:hypothetical protein